MDSIQPTDAELLIAYTARADSAAFAALRARYLNLVYAAASRQTSDAHQAEDVAQAVFLLLSQRAHALLHRNSTLAGWLLLTTRNVARNARRQERRIKQREQKAAAMRPESAPDTIDTSRLATVIDHAMAELNVGDRDVLAERFFRAKSVTQVAATLRINESAAGKRIARALIRLRDALSKLGITTTDAALAIGLPIAVSCPPLPISLSTASTTTSASAARLARSAGSAARLPLLIGIAAVLALSATAILLPLLSGRSPAPSQNAAAPIIAAPVSQSPQSGWVTLRLIDPATKAPIPNATVSKIDDNNIGPQVPASADGTFTFRLPHPLTFLRVFCRAPGRVPMEMNFVQGTFRGDLPHEYIIPMAAGTRIGGMVTDSAGAPLAGVAVRVSDLFGGPEEIPRFAESDHVTTGPDGRWHFDDAPADLNSVMIELRQGRGEWLRPDVSLPAKALRDGTFVQQLNRHTGRAFTGIVTDASGHPVPKAVIVFADDQADEDKPTGRTSRDGHFQVSGVEGFEGETIATVTAAGFAPSQQHIDEKTPANLTFHLQPGAVLTGTVVDATSQPVEDATIEVESWNDDRALTFSTKTDEDGGFLWPDAPSDPVYFNVSKDRFATLYGAPAKAGTPAHFVLHKPVTVSGTITDADTHAPINNFKMMYGIQWRGQPDVSWQTQDSQTLTGGKYAASIFNFSNGGKIRVDADGYQPAISRLIRGDEKNITVNFVLHKGTGPGGVVLSPAGKLLSGVKVICVPAGTRLQLDPESEGRLSEFPDLHLTTTDANGAFQFPAFDAGTPHFHLVVDAPAGLGKIDDVAFTAAGRQLRLQPWGTLRGTFRRNASPAAGASVTLDADWGGLGSGSEIDIERQTTTDAAGHFSFDNIPPDVSCRLWHNVPIDARSAYMVTIGSAKVAAGQTLTTSFGGVGRPVIGTVAFPPGVPANSEMFIVSESGGRAAAMLRSIFGGSPPPQIEFVTLPDHTFRADDVLPGTYELTVRVHTPFTPETPRQQQLADGTAELVVPAVPPCPTDTPLNLGEIKTNAIAK